MRTVLGLWWLLVLVVRSRFRLGGAYWTWRRQTAMGDDRGSARGMLDGVLEYARWLERMRRIAR